jgi:phosphoenolpyruvate carboxylase
MARIEVPVSAGELVDKQTILEIKSERIADTGKLANVRRELAGLSAIVDPMLKANARLAPLKSALKTINETLWEIEDDIRDCERSKDFGPKFIELARSVYRTNDQRAAAKRRIDDLLGSEILEEKSYQSYD